jgi:hypothetical protein
MYVKILSSTEGLLLFSQRHGFKVSEKAIQLERIDDVLRSALWDALTLFLWEKSGIYEWRNPQESNIYEQIRLLWHSYFKKPIDTIPNKLKNTIYEVRKYFFEAEWFEVYDIIEFISNEVFDTEEFRAFCNGVLTRENSAYRFIDERICPISSSTEIESIETALANTDSLSGIQAHLLQALDHLSDRKKPDFRNSIKESISAVEGVCQYLTGNDKATLGQALSILEKADVLHPALKSSFSSLYGYTSDADGIRHSMMDVRNLTYVDAKYMLVVCTTFINYMLGKVLDIGYKIPDKP